MKRKVMLITMIVVFFLGTTASVAAIYRNDFYTKQRINQGYTEEDMLELSAVLYLSEENVRAFVLQKYDELKDWKKVREYYGVSEEKYENYMIGQRMRQETLASIPNYIFDEMENKGWTALEIHNFVNKTDSLKIDYEYAWKECKAGRAIEDIVKEKMAIDKEKSNLDTEFVRGEMTVQEYEAKLKAILGKDVVRKTDNMIADTVTETNDLREKTRQRHKESSGITDQEIEYCKSQGITNPMDMYQAKNISKGNNISFKKVIESKKKNKDWTKAVADVLNIPYDEYKQQNERARMR